MHFATLTVTEHTGHNLGTVPQNYTNAELAACVSRLIIVVHVLKVQDAPSPVRFGRVHAYLGALVGTGGRYR